jgi:hypothetical protein
MGDREGHYVDFLPGAHTHELRIVVSGNVCEPTGGEPMRSDQQGRW